jgi:hypothetical protein
MTDERLDHLCEAIGYLAAAVGAVGAGRDPNLAILNARRELRLAKEEGLPSILITPVEPELPHAG